MFSHWQQILIQDSWYSWTVVFFICYILWCLFILIAKFSHLVLHSSLIFNNLFNRGVSFLINIFEFMQIKKVKKRRKHNVELQLLFNQNKVFQKSPGNLYWKTMVEFVLCYGLSILLSIWTRQYSKLSFHWLDSVIHMLHGICGGCFISLGKAYKAELVSLKWWWIHRNGVVISM